MDLNTINGATDKQKFGAAMFSDKLNVMVAGARALNPVHNSNSNEAFNLFYALAHRMPYPEQFNPDDVRELLRIRREYDLEKEIRFDVLAEAFHVKALFG